MRWSPLTNAIDVRGGSEKVEKVAYSIAEAAAASNISRSRLYELLTAGEGPPTIKLGRRRLIRRAALDEWLASLEGIDELGVTTAAHDGDGRDQAHSSR
jgi:excisionase family DNA binding protein